MNWSCHPALLIREETRNKSCWRWCKWNEPALTACRAASTDNAAFISSRNSFSTRFCTIWEEEKGSWEKKVLLANKRFLLLFLWSTAAAGQTSLVLHTLCDASLSSGHPIPPVRKSFTQSVSVDELFHFLSDDAYQRHWSFAETRVLNETEINQIHGRTNHSLFHKNLRQPEPIFKDIFVPRNPIWWTENEPPA